MSDLSDMEARVQAAVAEEQRQGQAQEKQEAVTPDFVAKCSNFRGKGRRSAPLRSFPRALRLCA